jgi:hypothetical protein
MAGAKLNRRGEVNERPRPNCLRNATVRPMKIKRLLSFYVDGPWDTDANIESATSV